MEPLEHIRLEQLCLICRRFPRPREAIQALLPRPSSPAIVPNEQTRIEVDGALLCYWTLERCRQCRHKTTRAIVHEECYRLVDGTFSEVAEVIDNVVAHLRQIYPTSQVRQDRVAAARLQQTLNDSHIAARLGYMSLHTLPQELRIEILNYASPCPLLDRAVFQWTMREVHHVNKRNDRLWNPQKPFLIEYTTIMGVEYVGDIIPDDEDCGIPTEPGRIIAISNEHGVISVVCTREAEILDANKAALWYKILESDSILSLKTKGFYLQSIEGPSPMLFPVWDTSHPPPGQSDFWSEAPPTFDFSKLRMRDVCLQNIHGLTVCGTLGGFLAISNTPRLGEQHEEPAGSVQIHFPLFHEEFIVSVWIRACSIAAGTGTLVISTSLGRQHVFGPCVPEDKHHLYTFHRIGQGEPRSLFYNDQSTHEYGRILGISTASISTPSAAKSKLVEWPDRLLSPPTSSSLDWYYSEAALSGATTIFISREQDNNHPVGALITYLNHTTAVLGQWSKRNTTTTKHVITGGNLLRWTEHENRVEDIKITNVTGETIPPCSTTFTGTLVWYFSLSSLSAITHVPDPRLAL